MSCLFLFPLPLNSRIMQHATAQSLGAVHESTGPPLTKSGCRKCRRCLTQVRGACQLSRVFVPPPRESDGVSLPLFFWALQVWFEGQVRLRPLWKDQSPPFQRLLLELTYSTRTDSDSSTLLSTALYSSVQGKLSDLTTDLVCEGPFIEPP